MVNHKENLNHALVLGGGGSLAIGWQWDIFQLLIKLE